MYKTYFPRPPPPPPPQKGYTSTFFKWIICHENDENMAKMLKVYRINVFPIDPPKKSMFCTVGLTLTIMDGHLLYFFHHIQNFILLARLLSPFQGNFLSTNDDIKSLKMCDSSYVCTLIELICISAFWKSHTL